MNNNRRLSLLLSLVAVLPLAGCDTEADLGSEASALELADASVPAPASASVDLELTSDSSPAASLQYVWAYEGVSQLSAVGDGDVVMIRNILQGFVGCDASGEVQTQHAPYSIDAYLWEVHRSDIDGDGTDEMQFELIDDTGPTGTYLKMNSNEEVFCGPIFGIGDAAAWSFELTTSTAGTHYRKIYQRLLNYKRGLCMQIGDDSGSGASCGALGTQDLNVEIMARASS